MNSGIIKKIFRAKDIKNIEAKLKMLGNNRKIKFSAVEFLNARIITTIILTILMLIFNVKYYIIPFVIIIYYNMFYYFLITNEINKRIKRLNREALTFFEILTLTLESGRNLENALQITVKNVDGELSNEFKQSLIETNYGRSLMESLEDLKSRIPAETINNIILNMKETNVFGNSIIETMNNQVDYLREKQIMEVKARINKIPNKISIISVIFIIPLILLIILGPFIIDLL